MLPLVTGIALVVIATQDDTALPSGEPIHVRVGDVGAVRLRAPAAEAGTRWFVAVPRARDYDNDAVCRSTAEADCHAAIDYDAAELPGTTGQAAITVGDQPALAALGTHRVGAFAADTQPELDEEAVSGLVEIVVRGDDSYLGHLTELLGVPFVLWPRPIGGVHQTDARLGADCVALVIYGRRRSGHPVPFVAPGALARFLIPVRRARPGDVLHFGFQTAVLYEDRSLRGVVDADDRIIHTFHGVAEITRLGDAPYGRAPFRVLRWRE